MWNIETGRLWKCCLPVSSFLRGSCISRVLPHVSPLVHHFGISEDIRPDVVEISIYILRHSGRAERTTDGRRDIVDEFPIVFVTVPKSVRQGTSGAMAYLWVLMTISTLACPWRSNPDSGI